MKKHLGITIVLVILCLLVSYGIAQATRLSGNDIPNGSINLPIPQNLAWRTAYVHNVIDNGSHVSIAFDPDKNDAPWIAEYAAESQGLLVAHYVGPNNGNLDPGNAWYGEIVDQEDQQVRGFYTSIDVYPDTNPDPMVTTWKVGVSYYDATNRSLKFARLKCPPSLPCSWFIYTVDASEGESDDLGLYSSMKFDSNGIPHIAYFATEDAGAGMVFMEVKHAYLVDDGTGNCGDNNNWVCDYVDASLYSVVGLYPSLDIDYQDNVHIAYYEGGDSNHLLYAHESPAGNCGIDNQWDCQVIDDQLLTELGLFPSIYAPKTADDFLRIAYYDKTHGNIKFAYDISGSYGNCGPGNGWQCLVVDYMGVNLPWASVSLALDVNQTPMIAYSYAPEDLGSYSLRIARPASLGDPTGTCLGDFGDWNCYSLDRGDGYIDVGVYAALGINARGMGVVAYSEQLKDYPGTTSLKVAYQALQAFLPITEK